MVKSSSALRALGVATLLGAVSVVAVTQTSSPSQEYASVLNQISDAKLRVAQSELFVAKQEEKISFLEAEIALVPDLTASVDEMMGRAATQAENLINTDVPFLIEERRGRMEKLREDMEAEDMPVGEKYRRLLALLKIEAEYGVSVEAYEGVRPTNNGEQQIMVPAMIEKLGANDEPVLDDNGEPVMEQQIDGTTGEPMMVPEEGWFVRYGRVGLAYVGADNASARRWDTNERTWVDLSGSELINVRRALRIARGESAPAVLSFPVRPEGAAQ